MNFCPKISVIIPTYNRSKYLIKIITKIANSRIRNEIIICDSNSKDQTKEKIKKIQSDHKNQIIRYINIKKNISAIKRNVGAKLAQSKYIVFLDDDCVPEDKFLENFYQVLERFKNKEYLFCGTVYYPYSKINNNLINYRQSRHFKVDKKNKIGNFFLQPKNIVTMVMAVKKKTLFDNNLFFNEKFNKYGFEDYEFGFRAYKKKIRILPCSPVVFHHDLRGLKEYLNKIKFSAYEGSKYLVRINKAASLENNYVNLENKLIIKLLAKSMFISKLMIFMENLFISLEKNIRFPNIVYRIFSVNSYLIGHFLSKSIKKKDKNFQEWYR
jgi:glycosyltransferase involved in cell wall biosynthesis